MDDDSFRSLYERARSHATAAADSHGVAADDDGEQLARLLHARGDLQHTQQVLRSVKHGRRAHPVARSEAPPPASDDSEHLTRLLHSRADLRHTEDVMRLVRSSLAEELPPRNRAPRSFGTHNAPATASRERPRAETWSESLAEMCPPVAARGPRAPVRAPWQGEASCLRQS